MWCCRKQESAADIAAKGLEKELEGNAKDLKSAADRKSSLVGWQSLASRLATLLAVLLAGAVGLLAYKFGIKHVMFHRKVILLAISFAISWRINKLTERAVKLRETRHELLHRCANELPLKAARELLGRYAPDGGNAYLAINPNMEKQMTDLRDGCRELLRIVDHLVRLRGAEVPREQLEAELGAVGPLVKKYAQHLSPAARQVLTAGVGERILGLMGATPTAARGGGGTPGGREPRTPRGVAATPRAAPNTTVLQTIHDDDADDVATPAEDAVPQAAAAPPSSGRVRRRLHADDDDDEEEEAEAPVALDADEHVPPQSDSDGAEAEQHAKGE